MQKSEVNHGVTWLPEVDSEGIANVAQQDEK